MNDITGIVVCHNTKDLIERAYNSVRSFHPDMPIIIVDGSDRDNPCAIYVSGLTAENTTIIHPGRNIGHGRGMHLGITYVKTKYALIFDSDTEMLKSPVPAMLEMMEEDTFGIGRVRKINIHNQQALYLHPRFQLISIDNYRKFHRYIHHGAPCYLTMLDIKKKGGSEKILKEFPDLDVFIKHYGQGTRNMRKKCGLSEIEGGWECA